MMCPGLREASPHEAIDSEDMRAYELNAVWWGFPLAKAMENAGRALADLCECVLGSVRGKNVAILVGKGGNGGDGLVAARHLVARGARVEVHMLWDPSLITHPDARENARYVISSKKIVTRLPYSKGWLEIKDEDIVIDAIFGTGIRGGLRSPAAEAIKVFNGSSGLRVSADIPSGLDPDNGVAVPGAARADYTVTMYLPKKGLFIADGPMHAGRILVADIGLPPEAEGYAGPGDVAARIPERPPEAYKGMGGKVMVIGGSEEFVGAPIISAIAAALAGADLVYLAAPGSFAIAAATSNPHLIPVPRGSAKEFIERLQKYLDKVHSLVLGPGLGSSEDSELLVEGVLNVARGKPIVIDADALRVVAKLGRRLWPEAVLTPHRGEAALLAGEMGEPLYMAKSIANAYGATVVVKAPVDAICSGERCRLNRTGHQAMAVGGTGDALAGIIAAFLARRVAMKMALSPLHATAAATYVSGRAGELAVAERGENITALHVVEKIPQAILEARRTVAS